MSKQPPRPAIATAERRSGEDRRRRDGANPKGAERRRSIEPRGPEVSEVALPPEEWQRLYGKKPPTR
ncbi:MAG: hypothetical protein H6932_16795 [Burkholderiaceae bacterium]|uniref:Uncharacterized protein n=1 Tax=Rubrivivax albus TaxID=2499835 RepID=A0A437JT25_9BURK|nr:hypothetical protein [Rubrivivax albus]MCP5272858.1 hypothetical protein [Burkholderiaceae bacterium]RVT50080.1 hypothetical protein ENE75_17340 [Rubrivivax albus]